MMPRLIKKHFHSVFRPASQTLKFMIRRSWRDAVVDLIHPCDIGPVHDCDWPVHGSIRMTLVQCMTVTGRCMDPSV